jgi:YbbR domain-containing protein
VVRFVVNQLGSLVLAAILAVTVWVVATNDANPSRRAFYPDALPIEFRNRAENLMVFHQSDATIRVELRAPQASWDQLRPGSFHVVADLSSLQAGQHTVNLDVRVDDSRVTVTSIEPQVIDVQLELVKSRQMDVRSDVLDAAPPGYTSRSPVVTPSRVTLSGPAVLVDQVNDVAADVYLRGSKAPIQRDVTVLARDAQGNLIQGVTVTPATVSVVVQVEQRVGFKDVSIRAVLKGAPAAGYWVSNITVNPSTATIVGSPDAMAKVAGFVETVPIDITGGTADVSRRAILSLPEGLSVLNNEGITVQVSVTPLLGGQTVRRKVTTQGLVRGLTASVSPDSVDVILSGPLPNLQALLPDDVQIAVDATGQTPGVYVVKPRVILVPDPLKVQSIVPDSVQVTILAIVPTVTPTLTPTLSVTATVTPTLTISSTVTPTR